MLENITQGDIDARKSALRGQEYTNHKIEDITNGVEEKEGIIFSADDRVALWQFGRVNLTHDKLSRTKGKFLSLTQPLGFMVTDEGDVIKLNWKIQGEEYEPTRSLLANIGFTIYDSSFTTPELKKAAHKILDFSKSYYRE